MLKNWTEKISMPNPSDLGERTWVSYGHPFLAKFEKYIEINVVKEKIFLIHFKMDKL